jgi:hypothetical protein|tara:strand:- start:593 stop:1012 length:420 start_codon:yes stop_codon:yes gene_type:complete
MNQLELFNLPIPDFEGGLECNNCGVVQPVQNFQHMPSGEIKRKCRTCARDQSRLVKHLKKFNAYPDKDYACPICERKLKEIAKKGQERLQAWVLDHCHDTETFRGWLCFNCNTGLGAFKDDLHKVRKAVEYLEKHEEKL